MIPTVKLVVHSGVEHKDNKDLLEGKKQDWPMMPIAFELTAKGLHDASTKDAGLLKHQEIVTSACLTTGLSRGCNFLFAVVSFFPLVEKT